MIEHAIGKADEKYHVRFRAIEDSIEGCAKKHDIDAVQADMNVLGQGVDDFNAKIECLKELI